MAGHLLLLRRADNFDDTQLIAGRLPGVVGERQPDPVAVQDAVTGWVDAPGAVHPEMGVHGQAAFDPEQKVLPAGQGLGDGAASRVGGPTPGNWETRAG